MQTCHFFSKGEHAFSSAGLLCADVQNHPFPTRRTTFSMGHVRAMPFRTLRGLRELARGKPICCTCRFPAITYTISWPCAPAHAETSAPVSAPAKGAMCRMFGFQLGKLTFRATRPPCRSFVFGSRCISIRNQQAFNGASCGCVIAAYCVQRWGEHVGTHEARSPGARFAIQKGAPVEWWCPPKLSPPAASLQASTAVATQRGHAILVASAGKLTLSEMRRFNASFHYC